MNAKRFYVFMLAISALLSGGLFAMVYFGNNFLKNRSAALMEQKLSGSVIEEQQNTLIRARTYIEKYESLGKQARQVVPQDKNQAQAVREIVKIAGDSGVALGSITFPSSSLGEKASANKSASDISQAKPAEGIKGVYFLEITVQSDPALPIPYNQFISFLERLEKNRRTAQVTNVTIKPENASADELSFTLVLRTYIKP